MDACSSSHTDLLTEAGDLSWSNQHELKIFVQALEKRHTSLTGQEQEN